MTLVEGVVAPGPHRRADQRRTPSAGRWTGCPPSTAPDPAARRYELLWSDDVPDAVAINEAVDLARTLSTDDSPAFVNGLLGRIAAIADHLRTTL